MKQLIINAVLFLFMLHVSNAQNMEIYIAHVKIADSLYDAKDYIHSADEYQKAIDSNEGKAMSNDRYNAACSFALAGNSEKAFYHLFYLAEHPKVKYRNLSHITTDTDLDSLHALEPWERLIQIVKTNKYEAEKDLDQSLVATLDAIYQDDQMPRHQIDSVEQKYGRDSKEMQDFWKEIAFKDSINLINVQKILDDRGWVGPKIVGEKGSATLFLVIQHAPLDVQEKYLPMMKEAVKNGNARSESLALLEDRVLMRKGKKQIYGSQIGRNRETGEYYVSPIEDPENVNERRAAVGLGTIESYVSRWGITWDVQKHIEYSKTLEAEK